MTKKRVVLVLDYYKVHYLKETAQGVINNYWATETGVELWESMFKAIPSGVKLDMTGDVEYFIEFAYDAIPDIVRENKRPEFHKYKALNNTQIKESGARLIERLQAYKPDIIVPMGGWACKVLLGQNSITKLRGKPEKIKIGDMSTWVLATFSSDAVRVNMKNKPLQDIDLEMLMRFLAEGETAFQAKKTVYTSLTNKDYDQAVQMFQTAMQHGKTVEDAVAWDFETNTLSAEREGSRILTVSLSWESGQGVTIPINHPRQQWEPKQAEHINQLLFDFISSDIYKVGANIQFDIRFAKFQYPTYLKAVKNMDIQAGYYIAISQEELDSKGLKTLAFYYTDMGGYDAPVAGFEKFFKSIVKELNKRFKKREKDEGPWNEYLNEGFSCLGISVPEYVNDEDLEETMMVINELMAQQGTADIRNPIDGENYSYEWIPYRILTEYASGDADVTLRIHKRLYEEEISTYDKWVNLYTNHYPNLMNTLADIEVNGMQVDRERLIEIRDAFEKKRQEIYEELQSHELVKKLAETKEALYMEGLAEKAKKPADRDKAIYSQYTKYRKPEDRELKITSPYDKGMLLYGLTGYMLEPNRQTLKDSAFTNLKDGVLKPDEVMWSDFKTGEENVSLLMEKYPDFTLGKVLLEFSKAEKLVTTYTQSILDKTDSKDVLHGRLVSTRTETSRLASRNPNLQNFPRHIGNPARYDYSYPIKSYFVPLKEFGHDTLVQFDYSAQELRLASVVANDEQMMKAFMDGKDVHKETASIAFGVPVEEVTSDLRSDAKAVSFGLLYGETPQSFSAKNNMTEEEAEKLFDKYFEGKPLFKQMIDDAQEFAKNYKFIEIPGSGFRRKLLNVDSKDFSEKSKALRQATNTIIQGGSAYLMQCALIIINDFLQSHQLDAKIIVTVHDSMVASTRKELVPLIGKICKQVMENLPLDFLNVVIEGKPTYFKMEADFGVSINYNDECPYDEEMFNASQSSEGYCSWFMAEHVLGDLKNEGLISEEYADERLALHEQWKPRYQAVKALSDDPELMEYHKSVITLRREPVA